MTPFENIFNTQIRPGKVIDLPKLIIRNAPKNFVQEEMEANRLFLQSIGITDLSALSALSFKGNIAPSVGFLSFDNQQPVTPAKLIIGSRPYYNWDRVIRINSHAKEQVVTQSGVQDLLKSFAFTNFVSSFPDPFVDAPPGQIARRSIQPINTALIVGSEIRFENNTLIMLSKNIKHFKIIANKIVFGNNVSLSWDKSPTPPSQKPSKPQKPSKQPPITDESLNENRSLGRGVDGVDGVNGAPGISGERGPSVEIWALEIVGKADFIIDGQRGGSGGDGGDAQDGGDGGNGRGKLYDFFRFVKSGPGHGGTGGSGGRGGNGGRGGDGGMGGTLIVRTSSAQTIKEWNQGIYIDSDGGTGGTGGAPGLGGRGGIGGYSEQLDRVGYNGTDGSNGIQGSSGNDGTKGAKFTYSILEINEEEFNREYNKPGIFTISPNAVKNSDMINISGRRFTKTDSVSVDGVNCQSTIFGTSSINSIVNNVTAGKGKIVQVTQQDGTQSNRSSVDILPFISYVEFNGTRSDTSPPGHFNQDVLVTVKGSGFTSGMFAKINDLSINSSEIQIIDKNTLKLPLRKSPNIQRNPAGEKAQLRLYTLDGLASNEIEIIFATFQFLVFGDSMAWGQGLQDQFKTSTIVMNHIVQKRKGASLYREVFAHSGAIIGYGDNTSYRIRNGEVPDSYPTVFQQQAHYIGDKSKIDLILLDGGINDIGLTNIFIIDPTDLDRDIKLYELVERYCYHHMKQLLKEISATYINAKIIVTGYPQIVSEESQIEYLAAFLFALGIPLPPTVVMTLAIKHILVKRSKIVAERSDIELKKAVDEVNSSLANSPRIFYCQPSFNPNNSIFASESCLWGLSLEKAWEGADKPELGGVSTERAFQCHVNNGPGHCFVASIGHPNVRGASEYAKSIIEVLNKVGT